MRMNKTMVAFRDESISEPIERHWLADGKVEKCFNYSENASYKTFIDYLRYLRDAEPFYWQRFQPMHFDSKV